MKTFKRLAGLSGLTAVLLAATGCSSSTGGDGEESFKEQELTYATAFAPGGLNTSMETWAEAVGDATDGAVKVNFHYSESLVSGFETLSAVSDGVVDMGAIPPSYNPSELPLANVLSIPFQTDNAVAQMWTFYEMVRENELLRQEYEKNNIHLLMLQPAGGGALGLSSPITDYTGLQGKRLRAIGFVVPGLQALGAETLAINPGELYEAIQRGVADGYGAYVFDNIASIGLQEVAPNTYDIGIGQYSVQVIGVNLDVWNALDPDVQQLMTEEAERFMSEDAAAVLGSYEEETCDAIREVGGSVTVLAEDDLSAVLEQVGDKPTEAWVAASVAAGVSEADVQAFHEEWLERIADNEEKYSDYIPGLRACAVR